MRTFLASLCILILTAFHAGAQPAINSGGVLNAASYIRAGFPNSGIAQGSLFVIFGRNLGPSELTVATGLPKPKSLAGTSVQVLTELCAVDAFLYYTSSTQVAAILPSTCPPGEGTLRLTYQGTTSPPVSIHVTRSAPGIFTRNQVGFGQAIVQNVVTPTSLTLNEVTEAAKPGQAAILWGTGLGPISGDDAGAPPVGNLSAEVEVLVGNRSVRPFYYGRSGSLPGIDQINFYVPGDVEGCRVPVAVKVDGVVSNYATMAISSSSRTCSDPASLPPADLERLRETRDGRMAWIALSRFSVTFGAVSFRQEEASAEAFRGNLAEMLAVGALGSLVSAPALGTCTVYVLPEPGNDAVLEPTHPIYRQLLDAGPALSLVGPLGQKNLPRTLEGNYQVRLGEGPPPSTPLPHFLASGTYRVSNGNGGAGLGPLEAALNLPLALTWTNEAEVNDVSRSENLTVTWSGGDPDSEFVLIAGASLNHASKAQGSFVCSERVAAGRFVVPATVLSSLPASSTWTGTGVPSCLGVVTRPTLDRAKFTAPGLDLGLFYYDSIRIKTVHYR
jgi:uncharacterized protein (TIGR03437 family)